MALQVGTVDGLINIGPKITDVFVKAIAAFAEQGVEYAKDKGIPFGAAFQRFTYPVYSGESAEFDVTSIDTPVYTKSGKEQSPAFITYCRKMGLLVINESKSLFGLTLIGEALLDGRISLQDYALIILSKQGVFQNGIYKAPLFTHIVEMLNNDSSITVETLQQYISTLYNDNDITKTRFDILLGAFATSGLLVKDDNTYYIGGLKQAKVFEDIAKHCDSISPALLDDDDDYTLYMGEGMWGIFDILLPSNINVYQELFPKLTEFAKLCGTYLEHKYQNSNCIQQIFYGAPGTGKSHTVNEKTKEAEERGNVFRTTFHPDSDYSTFVGTYKPTMRPAMPEREILEYADLVLKFKDYLAADSNITRACTKFGFDYYDSIVLAQQDNAHSIPVLVADAYKPGTTYDTQVRSGMSVYETSYHDVDRDEKIIYRFIPQAFINAYIQAWKTEEPVYLIIEEINRGNCAQIFGDLFQLLDRDRINESKYPIDSDSDLRGYIESQLHGIDRIPKIIREGRKMKLPRNLYIWATMNTSDQSLFPIDSAFKRRWEWKYIKITKPNDSETGQPLNWKLEYNNTDWWEFIQKINAIIASMTSSADKQLGYFFCKPDKGDTISNERFVNKVAFYLWNDVFKDYAMDEGKLFKFIPKDENGNDKEETDLTYPDFYDDVTGKEQNYVIEQFIKHVMDWQPEGKRE